MRKSIKNYFYSIALMLALVLGFGLGSILTNVPASNSYADATPGKLVIWEVNSSPDTTSSEKCWDMKYVVIKNIGGSSIDASGWSIQAMSGSKVVSTSVIADNTTIESNGYYVIVANTNKNIFNSSALKTLFENNNFTRYNTATALYNIGAKQSMLLCSTPDKVFEDTVLPTITSIEQAQAINENIVDIVGGSTATAYLVARPGTTTAGNSLIRINNTNNNSIDFSLSATDAESLNYLFNAAVTYKSVSEVKALAIGTEATLKATLTHINSTETDFTFQDATGAIMVSFGGVRPSTIVPTMIIGKSVKLKGTTATNVTSGQTVLVVDSDVANIEVLGDSVIAYSDITLADLSNNINKKVSFENVTYNIVTGEPDTYNITNGTITLTLNSAIGTLETNKVVYVEGILRHDGTNYSLDTSSGYEMVDYAYGSLDTIRTLSDSTTRITAQGYVTFVKGTQQLVIADDTTGLGIYLKVAKANASDLVGQLIRFSGEVDTFNGNKQLFYAKVLETITPTTQTKMAIQDVNTTGVTTDMLDEEVSFVGTVDLGSETATPTSTASYNIQVGTNTIKLFLDEKRTYAHGDEIKVDSGVVYYNSNVLWVRVMNDNVDYTSLTVAQLLADTTIVDGTTDVAVRGVVTVIDTTDTSNYKLVIQSGDKGLLITNVPSTDIGNYQFGQAIIVTGTYYTSASATYLAYTNKTNTSVTAPTATSVTISDLTGADKANYYNTLVKLSDLRVTEVKENKTYTVSPVGDSTTTYTTVLNYNASLTTKSFVTLTGVIYKVGTEYVLQVSSSANVINNVLDIVDVIALSNNQEAITTGVVINIKTATANSERIENVVIEQTIGTTTRGINCYFGYNTTIANDYSLPLNAISLGDTIIVSGTRAIFNGLFQISYCTLLDNDTTSTLPTPIDTTIATLKVSENTMQSQLIKLTGVKLGSEATLVYGSGTNDTSVVIRLIDGTNTIDLYGVTMAQLNNLTTDIYEGDILNVIGVVSYYKKTYNSEQVGGIRIVVNSIDNTNLSRTSQSKYNVEFYNLSISDSPSFTKEMTRAINYKINSIEGFSQYNPTRAGYTFLGWVDYETYDSNSPVYVNTNTTLIMPTKTVRYLALWKENTYTITFNSNGGSEVTAISGHEGDTIATPTAPTKNGYKFMGWYTTQDFSGNAYSFSTMGNSNITLYAKWKSTTTEKDNSMVILIIVSCVVGVVVLGSVTTLIILSVKRAKLTKKENKNKKK